MHLVVPQGLAARTGGFAYDRRLVDGLRDRGWSVTVHELGPDFPRPSPGALSAAADILRSIPTGHDVVVDGLALGGMPLPLVEPAILASVLALVPALHIYNVAGFIILAPEFRRLLFVGNPATVNENGRFSIIGH